MSDRKDFICWEHYFDWLRLSTMEQIKKIENVSITRQVKLAILCNNHMDKDAVY